MEKTLDLKMPGVMELGREELKKVDGGCVLACLVIGGIIGALFGQDLDDLGDAFEERRAAYRNK